MPQWKKILSRQSLLCLISLYSHLIIGQETGKFGWSNGKACHTIEQETQHDRSISFPHISVAMVVSLTFLLIWSAFFSNVLKQKLFEAFSFSLLFFIGLKGRTIYRFFFRLWFDPYCNLCLLLPLFVCTCVVIFCNKNILKQRVCILSSLH